MPKLSRASLTDQFTSFISAADFPCVGAKAAIGKGRMSFLVGRDIRSGWNDLEIHDRLLDFAAAYRGDRRLFQSFVVIFSEDHGLDEAAFEAAMWARLQSLADKDAWLGQPHDPRVSPDPGDPHFSLSFGGEAFFVVGLHPRASRPARRFGAPALVFNLHDQFEQLRAQNLYDRLRQRILERDVGIAGSPNPMLARHGEISEARQYSGRRVGPDWRCPFQAPPRGAALGDLAAVFDDA